MSREIKRVPLDYEYVEGETWPGYVISCDGCEFKPGEDEECEQDPCVRRVEPPTGEGWQVWEDVSEGAPISPVFSMVELLIEHLHEQGGGGIFKPCTRAAAKAFVAAEWAPSMVRSGIYGLVDGINAFSATMHPFLHGFDQLSDDILDELKKRGSLQLVDSKIDELLLKFRERTSKFVQFHKALANILDVILNKDEGSLLLLPLDVQNAVESCIKLRDELYSPGVKN